MNALNFDIPMAPPTVPQTQQAENAKGADRLSEVRTEQRRDAEFHKLLREEMDRKKAASESSTVPVAVLPWMAGQIQLEAQPTDGVDAIDVLSQTNLANWALPRALPLMPVVARAAEKLGSQEFGREPSTLVVENEAHELPAPQRVELIIESGLPRIQPVIAPTPQSEVPLVQFPQVVAGTAQKMVKNNQLVTQLDFQITPPHIGPVNLEVTLHERVVNIQLVVPNALAKSMLESQTGNIAAILQAQNLTAGAVRIVTAAAGKTGAGATGPNGEPTGFGLMGGGRRRTSPNDSLTARNL